MTRVTKASPSSLASLAKVLALYYAFWGLFSFWTRFLGAKLDFKFHPQANPLSKPGFAFWIICLYALAGWLSAWSER
jgi:Ni/Fe-hydrogenase subunit HybB-like protein